MSLSGLQEDELELDAQFEVENPNSDDELDASETEALEKAGEILLVSMSYCFVSFCQALCN